MKNLVTGSNSMTAAFIAGSTPSVIGFLLKTKKSGTQQPHRRGDPNQGYTVALHPCCMFNFQSCFSPRVFLLGPFFKGHTDELKRRLTARFIKDYNLKESIFDKISMNITKFREYYDGDCYPYSQEDYPPYYRVAGYELHRYSDEELTRMFIVDGCALLFYMVCYLLDDLHKLGIEDASLDLLRDDIFKLHNQLPYAVLEILIECSQLGKDRPSLIHDFVELHNVVPGMETSEIELYKPVHLLDLLWTRMIGKDPLHGPNLVRQFSMALTRCLCPCTGKNRETRRSFPCTGKNRERKKGSIKWSPSHSIKELKAAWIHLKPSAMLKHISFKPGIVSGEMELPRLTIDESTKVKLLNLICYEMCPHFRNQNDLEVTSYICFLRSFVANVDDVAELQSAGILLNYLSNNEEVIKLFSDITSGLVPNPAPYHAIRQQIHNHLDRKGRKPTATWFAEAAQVYFKTPWSTLTVLAAAFAIILSVVQTYFTIFPRKES